MEEQQVAIMMQPEAEVTSMEVVDDSENIILPEYELQLVLEHLPVKDLKVAREVCKHWAVIGGIILAKRSRIFMKTDETYRRMGFETFLDTAANPEKNKFMRFRDIELYHVNPGDTTIGQMLKSPCVKDSIASLRIHGPQLKWIQPVLPHLDTLKLLGFDDTHHFARSPDSNVVVNVDEVMEVVDRPDPGADDGLRAAVSCGLEALEVHINGPVCRNPLSWLLPMTPALKNMKLVIVNTNQLIHCAEVFRDHYAGPGLKILRISGSFGYTWGDSGEKIPDREGARALSEFLACQGVQGLKNLAIHAPCYPFEWRDKILNASIVKSLVSLQMDVYLRVNQEDFTNPQSLRLNLNETPRNPEPQDYLSAFPKENDGVTMPNLMTLKIDVDIRGNEVQVEPEAYIVMKTTRVFPSLVELEIDVRMLRFIPVDITNSFSHAFPSLTILSIGMSSASLIRPLLVNLPRGLKHLKVRCTTCAGKYDNFPRTYEAVNQQNAHRLTDEELLDGELLSNFPELADIFIDFNCTRLTDRAVFDGFVKMTRLKKLALGGPPDFSQEALTALKDKAITFTSAWRDEY